MLHAQTIPAGEKTDRVTLTDRYTVKSVSLGSQRNETTDFSSAKLPFYSSARPFQMPGFAIKTNLLYGATLTPNLGIEFGIGHKSTIDLSAGYNFYEPDNGKQWQHWLVQPEYRWWFCERFNGMFVGGHLLGGQFNFSGINFPFNVLSDLKNSRYEGEFYGLGGVFGYQWILSKRWSFEAAIGVGYVRVEYDKYGCNTCGPSLESGSKNYFGPTKASVSLLFFL
jgi:Protein of unknown function (DUF3575).